MMSGERKKRKEKTSFTVEIADLEQGPLTIDAAMPMEWLTERMTACEYDAVPINASVKLNVQASTAGIWVRGSVFANVRTQCGTCLKEIVLGVESTINSYLLPLSEYQKECEPNELTPEDLDREYYDGEFVTLDDLLGDAIMLELPMNPKCESACPGLAAFTNSATAVRPAIDPRLAPLMGIRINKEN